MLAGFVAVFVNADNIFDFFEHFVIKNAFVKVISREKQVHRRVYNFEQSKKHVFNVDFLVMERQSLTFCDFHEINHTRREFDWFKLSARDWREFFYEIIEFIFKISSESDFIKKDYGQIVPVEKKCEHNMLALKFAVVSRNYERFCGFDYCLNMFG